VTTSDEHRGGRVPIPESLASSMIAEIRKRLGLTEETLADLLGLEGGHTIVGWEEAVVDCRVWDLEDVESMGSVAWMLVEMIYQFGVQHGGNDRKAAEATLAWKTVLGRLEEKNKHPSPDYLIELIRIYGVPELARDYVAGRLSKSIAKVGRPDPLPPPSASASGGLFYLYQEVKDAFGGIEPHQYRAVSQVDARHARYKSFETRRKPRKRNLPRLRFVESQKVWKVKGAREEARRQVASRLGVSPETVQGWERSLSKVDRLLDQAE